MIKGPAMTIYSKILLAVLLLMTISLLGLSFIFYHITRESLWRISHELIHLELTDALHLISDNLEVLCRFGLDGTPANVKKAQDESAQNLRNIRFGKSGHIFVVDDQGIVLSHTDSGLMGRRITGLAWYVSSKGNTVDHIEFTWPDEARIGCISRFEPWDWNVVSSQSRAEVLGPVNRLQAITLWATLGIVILTAIILRFVILGIARPISKLTRASAALARGEEVEELKAGSTDEIGILTNTFIQMRNAIRDQFAKIRESEEKHRRLVNNLGREYFFFTHGTDGIFFYVSPSVTEMLGYDQAEFKAHYTAYLTDSPINPAAGTRTEECIKGIKRPPHLMEIRHKSDGFRQLEVTQAPILDPGGRVAAVEGLAHDVTDKMRMEELMIQSEKMLSVGGLAAGMAEATRKRVFEPFFTTKTVGLGTGLGLSVSYFIITENHGGEMAVESRPGAGTKFIIHLPLEGRQAYALAADAGTL